MKERERYRASVVWHKIQCKRKMYAPTYRIMNWDRQAPVIPISSYSLELFFFSLFHAYFRFISFQLAFRVCVVFFVRSFIRFSLNLLHCAPVHFGRYTILLCNLRRPKSKLTQRLCQSFSTPLLHIPHLLQILFIFYNIYWLFVSNTTTTKISQVVRQFNISATSIEHVRWFLVQYAFSMCVNFIVLPTKINDQRAATRRSSIAIVQSQAKSKHISPYIFIGCGCHFQLAKKMNCICLYFGKTNEKKNRKLNEMECFLQNSRHICCSSMFFVTVVVVAAIAAKLRQNNLKYLCISSIQAGCASTV